MGDYYIATMFCPWAMAQAGKDGCNNAARKQSWLLQWDFIKKKLTSDYDKTSA